MKKWYLFGLLLSLPQLSLAEKPWFFDVIGLDEQTLAVTGNASVAVSVLDSGVAFVGGLSDREFAKYSYTKDSDPFPSKIHDHIDSFYIHGTAMASIIASNSGHIQGIFPKAMISSRKTTPNPIQDSWIKAIEDILSNNSLGAGEEKIINISGGQRGSNSATAWTDLLSRIGRDGSKVIVAAVGNDGLDMRKARPDQKIWPAAYHPASAVNKKNDPVIRVAALAGYRKGKTPELLTTRVTGSRFGAGYVDIAAPGQNIPFFTPDNELLVGNGTSEATAIVSGVLAAMVSCNPHASTQVLKKTLFETADKYDSLKDQVTEGRVLNAGRAIRTFCQNAFAGSRHSKVKSEL